MDTTNKNENEVSDSQETEEALEANQDEHASDTENNEVGEAKAEEQVGEDGDDADGAEKLRAAEERAKVAEEKATRYKAERDRLKGKKDDKKDDTEKVASDDITVARLEARGVMNGEDQAFVLKFAKNEGVSPIEALEDDFVKARLEHNKKAREKKEATPSPSSRTGTPKKDLSYYVDRARRTGEMPDRSKMPQMFEKVQDELIKQAKGGTM